MDDRMSSKAEEFLVSGGVAPPGRRPYHDRVAGRSPALVMVVLAIALVATGGCQTFRYTQEDLERERHHLAEGDVAWYGPWSDQAGLGVPYFDPRFDTTDGFAGYGQRGSRCPP